MSRTFTNRNFLGDVVLLPETELILSFDSVDVATWIVADDRVTTNTILEVTDP